MNGREHRWFVLMTSVLPLGGLGVAMFLLWQRVFGFSDLVALVVMYVVCGLGISMGYHRLLAHRSFRTTRAIRIVLATAGAMAGQGPPLIWVAHHRRHHRVADRPGDPHSPHLDFEPGFRGMVAGLWHAHLGWLFDEALESDPIRYCSDLVREKPIRWLSARFVPVVIGGFVLSGLIGLAVGHTLAAFVTGVLWGGVVRLFLVNHMTYAVNSVGHYFGRRRYPTNDQSRNVAWLALASFGEAWHNNHHAFPRSFRHGMRSWEVDISACLIASLEWFGLATNVIRIGPERMAIKESNGRVAAGSFPAAAAVPLAHRSPASAVSATDVE
ncbi:MAG TPA: acyl-CoA desaturase [Pseudonocardiaceae bacterium]|nr:acyl-CoA desaturase [Pseudonocardiaceae bacterium]